MTFKFKISLIFVFVIESICHCNGQNYGSIKVKEEFEVFNTELANGVNICNSPSENDLGDAVPYLLDAYITMYKTTKDKAYLYKFMLEAMYVMENRYDGFKNKYKIN